MVRMFDFRTKFLSALVWVLAAIQLLMQPATGLLHSGCEGHSHRADDVAVQNSTATAPQSFWCSVEKAWHWVTHSGCCHHSAAAHSAVDAEVKSGTNRSHQCSSACAFCSRRKAESEGSHQTRKDSDNQPEDSSVPQHDFHQCEICQVVFAARVNTMTVQLPTQIDFVPLAEPEAVPVVEVASRFQLSPRGPPVV